MANTVRALLEKCRHPNRMRSSQLLQRLISNFERLPGSEGALIMGRGTLVGRDVLVLAQEKPQGRDAKRAASVNYGMMTAAGYWQVIDQLEQASKNGTAVLLLIDTPGADPSKLGSENLLAWSISASIQRLLTYRGPTVSVLIGEGGSGGALALQVADHRIMVDDAIYSTISPESCSAILFRSSEQVEKAMAILRPSAAEVLQTGIMDEIVTLPGDAMVTDHDAAARGLGEHIAAAFNVVAQVPVSQRLRRRADRYLRCGHLKGQVQSAPKGSEAAASSALPALPLEKFSRIDVTEGDFAAVRNAYFVAKGNRLADEEAQELLCPRDRGGCGVLFSAQAYEGAGWACPSCGRGERLTSEHWIRILCGGRPFEEWYADLDLSDLDHAGYDNPEYRAARQSARAKLGVGESLRVGIGTIQDVRCAIAISDFRFFGGTLGAVAGEKLWRLCQLAREEHLPLVTVTCSGGVRMQDGTLGLAQMAKTVAAVHSVMESNLHYISILADPCTGGALGSYATVANSILAEPGALIAFAGPRVMRLAGLPVNEATMVSDKFVEFGGVDEVVPRSRMRARVRRYLQLMPMARHRGVTVHQTKSVASLREINSWFEDLVARVGGVLQDYQDAADNKSEMVHA
ncbi:MAG TPA: carboxyl transferase domain-containing protein, partial [Myxococcota bacterium]|nr:carboxyl transferase domain-containing protein [Myxococcota bacterium]